MLDIAPKIETFIVFPALFFLFFTKLINSLFAEKKLGDLTNSVKVSNVLTMNAAPSSTRYPPLFLPQFFRIFVDNAALSSFPTPLIHYHHARNYVSSSWLDRFYLSSSLHSNLTNFSTDHNFGLHSDHLAIRCSVTLPFSPHTLFFYNSRHEHYCRPNLPDVSYPPLPHYFSSEKWHAACNLLPTQSHMLILHLSLEKRLINFIPPPLTYCIPAQRDVLLRVRKSHLHPERRSYKIIATTTCFLLSHSAISLPPPLFLITLWVWLSLVSPTTSLQDTSHPPSLPTHHQP